MVDGRPWLRGCVQRVGDGECVNDILLVVVLMLAGTLNGVQCSAVQFSESGWPCCGLGLRGVPPHCRRCSIWDSPHVVELAAEEALGKRSDTVGCG